MGPWNPELSRVLRRAYAGAARVPVEEGEVLGPVRSGGVGDTLRRLVREYLYVPDAQVGWVVPAGGVP